MTTPYRTNALVVTRSPLWLRALAALVPDDIGAEFAWYRRVSGGRWSRAPELPVARIVGWRRVSECPANWHVFTPDELNAMPPLFKKLRIVLSGYEGEHDALQSKGWRVVSWKANGGYGNAAGNENGKRERLWLSPHCLGDEALPLFAAREP